MVCYRKRNIVLAAGGYRHFVLKAFLALFVLAFVQAGLPVQAQDGVPDVLSAVEDPDSGVTFGPRIVGGFASLPNSWPSQAALLVETTQGTAFICGGSLIGIEWVLTAAHCVWDEPDALYSVQLGSQVLWRGGIVVDIVQVVIHPRYSSSTNENDIALLKLARPVSQPKMKLHLDPGRRSAFAGAGTLATVTGWGDTQATVADPTRLREVDMPIVALSACQQRFKVMNQRLAGLSPPKRVPSIYESQVCAGLMEGGKDSCQGDSGGPLMVAHGNGYVQIGVVSWGIGCAIPENYGVYTRASSFIDWLGGFVSDLTTDEPPPPLAVITPDEAEDILDAAIAAQVEEEVDIATLPDPVTDEEAVTAPEEVEVPPEEEGPVAGEAEGAQFVNRMVRLEVLPNSATPLGQNVRFKVTSDFEGYLLVLDINAKGELMQVFPNQFSDKAGKGRLVRAGAPITIPDNTYGFEFTAREPLGEGLLLALVMKSEADLDNISKPNKDLGTIADPKNFFTALAHRLKGKTEIDPQTGQGDFALAKTKYEIIGN